MDIQKPVQITVEDTNSEALISKMQQYLYQPQLLFEIPRSAMNKGYFKDEFAEQFVKGQGKKDVIIHRGYWCRVHIFNRLVQGFLTAGNFKKQIISLGCGYDPLAFQMIKEHPENDFQFIEIDLPSVVKQKIRKIDKSESIKKLFPENTLNFNWDEHTITSPKYILFGFDLSKSNQLKDKLNQFKIDFTIPTLVFAECVLTYIESNATTQLLGNLSNMFKTLSFLNYEMFNGQDQFGKMMVRNFEYRGCPLIGIDAFPSMQAHADRLSTLGYKQTEIEDMKTLYKKGTEEHERQRIEKIEMLDEWEEWNIMQSHYFISVSHNYDVQDENLHKIKTNLKLKLS